MNDGKGACYGQSGEHKPYRVHAGEIQAAAAPLGISRAAYVHFSLDGYHDGLTQFCGQ